MWEPTAIIAGIAAAWSSQAAVFFYRAIESHCGNRRHNPHNAQRKRIAVITTRRVWNKRRYHSKPPTPILKYMFMLTWTMVLQKKPFRMQYNTWHRTTTVCWLYSISVSRYPSSATIWRLKMKCFDIRWEINFYQKTLRSENFHPGTRDHSEFYKHASVFALKFKYKYKRFLSKFTKINL